MSLGVFIPARTKSKRLPNKLLLPMGDTNLFEIACKKIAAFPDRYGKYALACEEPFIEIAEKHGLKILLRDPETINLDDPIRITMGAVEQAEETHMMFLNPCLAFLRHNTILSTLKTFEQDNYDYATSVKEFHNWLLRNNGDPVTEIDYSSLNTKNILNYCQFAHCFHIFNRENFLSDGHMLQPDFSRFLFKRKRPSMSIRKKSISMRNGGGRILVYEIDVDGILCTNTKGEYQNAKPLQENIDKVNALFREGHFINIRTARGQTTGIDWLLFTKQQLAEWDVHYHTIGSKPYYDFIIDDKALECHKEDWHVQCIETVGG